MFSHLLHLPEFGVIDNKVIASVTVIQMWLNVCRNKEPDVVTGLE